jgi:hypothetical protein
VATKAESATPPPTVAPAPKENSAFTSRGPRIAKVDQLSPDDAKEFEASLKSKNTPSHNDVAQDVARLSSRLLPEYGSLAVLFIQ